MTYKALTIATALTLMSNTAIANDQQTIEELTAKINRLERVLEKVIDEQEAQPKVSLKPGLKVETADKAYAFGLYGFVQADAGFALDDTNDNPDATTIKRARLGVFGTVNHDWHYKFLTDFGNDDVALQDAFVSYTGLKNTNIKVGQFKEPYGLEQLTAAKYWTFAEKASMAALTPARSIGAGATYHYGKGLISAGVFGENVNKKRTDDEGFGVTSRITYVPTYSKNRLMHVGLSATHRSVDSQTSSVTFKNAGENTLTSNFVNVSISNAETVTSFTPEFAYTHGPFGFQGEYINTTVSRESASDVTLSGYYAEASYFLTGESRNYVKKKGVFGKIKPKANFNLKDGGLGAWQVAYRYSAIDLTDRDITGGTMNNHTLGLNWHPNAYTRFAINAIHSQTDEDAAIANQDTTIFLFRTQFEF